MRAFALEAGPAYLLKDINPGFAAGVGSSPSNFVRVGETVFFSASEEGAGGLWKTDGTAEGTLFVEGGVGNPRELTDVNGTLFFVGDYGKGSFGQYASLWKSDGTPAGTGLVRDIWNTTGINYGSPLQGPLLANVDGTLFFAAFVLGTRVGHELWKTDGSAEGTVLVKGIFDGYGDFGELGSTPLHLTNVGGVLFFTAYDDVHGRELWKSDGTEEGTVMVKDINPGANSSTPEILTDVGGTLYFIAVDQQGTWTWRSDGTAEGTTRVSSVGTEIWLRCSAILNGARFYIGYDAAHGWEPWKSDGTVAGTVLLKDINPGAQSGEPMDFLAVGETLFFTARNTTQGWELWKSDGTAEGTVLVKDIRPGPGGSLPLGLLGLGGALFFTADDGAHGSELWKSDGTAEGTVLVKDLYPGPTSGVQSFAFDMGGTLLFAGRDAEHGNELWRSDGTAEGTVQVKDIDLGARSSAPHALVDASGSLYFAASDQANGNALWRSDGTPAGTVLVKGLYGTASDNSPGDLTFVNGTLFFTAVDVTRSYRVLWKSDGTADGTLPVNGVAMTSISDLTAVAGTLFFTASYGGTAGLWKSDGTSIGTLLLKAITATDLTRVGNTLFFVGTDTTIDLWKSDGTVAGTQRVREISGRYYGYEVSNLTDGDGQLFFTAHGAELWTSDGTPGGTMVIRKVANPRNLTYVNGTLYFTAEDTAYGEELWKTDGTEAGTVLVKDIFPGILCPEPTPTPNGSHPSRLTNAGGTLFFVATDPTRDTQLWTSDGTSEGTVPVTDFPVAGVDSIDELVALPGGLVAFRARDRAHGVELWVSDGTPSWTHLLADVNPNAPSSTPEHLTLSGNSLYFAAYTPNEGREPWAIPLPTFLPPRITSTRAGAHGQGDWFISDVDVSFSVTERGAPVTATSGCDATTVAVDTAGTTFTCRASSEHGSAELSVTIKRDTVAPTLSCPASVLAASPTHHDTLVTYPAARANDALDPAPVVTYSQASGTLFPFGATTVTATATDAAGNAGTCSFAVMVRDSLAPVVSCPASVTAEAEDESGALVTYGTASVVYAGSAAPSTVYDHPSGGVFSLGVTAVEVTATDEAGRVGACTFTITVLDTTAPLVSCPGQVTVSSAGSDGAIATYTPATASDAVDPAPTLAYSQATGTSFPLGDTEVTVTATDAAGNSNSCTFVIAVRDTEAPSIACPTSVIAEATSPGGATVSYASASAADGVDAAPTVIYSQASGTEFALGTATVTATATDDAANSASCDFTVTVVDTTAPTLSCPGSTTVSATGATGAVVTYGDALTTDAVDMAPHLTYSHASGITFPLGATSVSVTATDAAGNSSHCFFSVTVSDTQAPSITCPRDVTAEATGPDGALVTYEGANATDLVTGDPALAYTAVSGTRFPLGSTTVVATATDAQDNATSCSFTVRVRDTTAPSVVCPANVAVQTSEASGVPVEFGAATASDLVTEEPALSYSSPAGGAFPVGTTFVTATATDAAGNAASCSFSVVVESATEVGIAGGVPSPHVCGCQGASPGGWVTVALSVAAWARVRGRKRS